MTIAAVARKVKKVGNNKVEVAFDAHSGNSEFDVPAL